MGSYDPCLARNAIILSVTLNDTGADAYPFKIEDAHLLVGRINLDTATPAHKLVRHASGPTHSQISVTSTKSYALQSTIIPSLLYPLSFGLSQWDQHPPIFCFLADGGPWMNVSQLQSMEAGKGELFLVNVQFSATKMPIN